MDHGVSKASRLTVSPYALEAARLLGQLIRLGRIDRGLSAQQLAERAGVSRGLVQRIEQGDPGCTIGAVFETARIVGVSLFDPEPSRLTAMLADNEAKLSLLPQSVRARKSEVEDDF